MLLYVKNIEKIYGQGHQSVKALKNVSFKMDKGEFIAVMGPSGSGKTTLLNMIATLDKPNTGFVELEGTDLTSLKNEELRQFRRDDLGFIFQDFNLLDTLTAYENIALPLSIQKVSHREIEKRVRMISYLLGIEDVLKRFPYEMSGGQKQRVSSARALITKPSLLLADEPTGALDSKSSRDLLERFQLLNSREQTSILMVTHDAFTASYASRILFIKDGRIFNELYRGKKSRKQFFDEIINVMTVLGGDLDDIL